MKTFSCMLVPSVLLFSVAVTVSAQPRHDGCRAGDTSLLSLTAEEMEAGWRSLFDGESFTGWHKYGGEPVGSAWKIENGAMVLGPEKVENWSTVSGGDVVTDEIFENFELSLEWRISEGGNSGIFYLVDESPEYGSAADTGLEMQVLDSQRHGDGKYAKHRAGDLYDLIEADERNECEVGEWNHVRILKRGPHVEHWMNGKLLLTVDLWTNHWDALLAASKFADWEGFGKSLKGRIGLQDHGDKVWYRSVKIRVL